MRPCLIASTPGTEGGHTGLLVLGPDGSEVLDRVPVTGLAVSPDGARLARLTWSEEDDLPASLMISDAGGPLLARRVDGLREPHSLLWTDDGLVAVSTLTNSLLWLDEAGTVTRSWTPGGTGDCWHLNGVCRTPGGFAVSAFGRFAEHRGWEHARDGAGVVVDPATGADLLTGLTCPHDPLRLADGWLVCNSGTGELRRYDDAGRLVAAADLGGWTRGLVLDGDRAWVGVSAHRYAEPESQGRVVAVDLATMTARESLDLPGREVFALCLVDEALVRGLSGTGAGTSSPVLVPPLPPSAASRPERDLPLPDLDLRWRVTGSRLSDADFLRQGRLSLADLRAALRVVGRPLESFRRVLDFGCGCARVTRHLAEATEAEVHACDVDAEAVEWCRGHVPGVHFVANDALPPLPYPDAHFDLVTNHSVFTHLPEDYQDAWLAELRRVTAPGGTLLLSVAGSHAFAGLVEQYRAWPADPAAIEESFYRQGFLYISDDGWTGSVFPDWYHSTFHSATYVIEHWSRFLDVLAVLPRAALGFQDVVVLRRPE